MKKTLIIYFFLLPFLVIGQNNLDDTRLTIIPLDTTDRWSRLIDSKTGTEIKTSEKELVDSLLIEAIEHYNSLITRNFMLINLTENEYKKFQEIDSLRAIYLPFLKRNGKLKQKSILKLSKEEQKTLNDLIDRKENIDSSYFELLDLGDLFNRRRLRDSLIISFGLIDEKQIVLKNYIRQYIPFLNKKGEKQVWINCACWKSEYEKETYWKKRIIKVADGGNCYFNMYVNIKTKKAYNLYFQGI